MRTVIQDLRYGFRMSLKSPAFTLVAVLTLAVGIAANTTVFSWIDTVLLRPLPGIADPPNLVAFETVTPNGEFITTSYPDFRDYRDHLKLISGMGVAQPNAFNIGDQDHAERIWGELVSGNYFDVLGVKPTIGRVFSRYEYSDKQGAFPVAVISYGLWNRSFNSDPGVIGRSIRVNRQQLTIIGVVPEEFRGTLPGLTFSIWIPITMGPQLNAMPEWMLRDRQSRICLAFARLNPGVTISQARAEIASLAHELAAREPRTNHGITATLFPIWKSHFGAQATMLGPLQTLMAVCAVVLLIVCANVANLLLARTTSRQREFGLRLALGAGRTRLARQILIETLVFAAAGTIVALPLALGMSRSLGYLLPPTNFPIALRHEISGGILIFIALACIIACVLSGVVPAMQSARADLNEVLKEGGRSGTTGSRSQRLRRLLVIAEVALALVAIIGAGLFNKSFQMARQIHPGFNANGVIISHLYLSSAGYSVPDRIQFCARLRQRLESQPGVTAVSYADFIPLGIGDGSWEDLQIDAYVPSRSENMKIYRTVAAPGYFSLLGIRLLDGRDFTEQDDLKSNPVMIVNEAFARRFFGGGYAIGRRVHGWGKWFTVVGLVKDSKYHEPNESQRPLFYVPFRQVYRADLGIAIYVRTAGDLNQAMATLRREVRALDSSIGLFDTMPLTEYISASLFAQKMAAALLGALGAIALVLAAVGMYSVMAYSVSQRTQEIGIRMALGARPVDVQALVVKQGMGLTFAGLLVGVAGAVAITRLAAGLLVNVSATDPLIFAGAAVFLALIALAASYVPALRATRIDPNAALRCE